MRITSTHRAVAVAVALAAVVAGCGSDSTDGQATAPTSAVVPSNSSAAESSDDAQSTTIAAGDGSFDLCSALTVADVAPDYVKTREPVSLQQGISPGDRFGDDRSGAVTCGYGVPGSGIGVSLAMSLAAEPVKDLKSLVASDSTYGAPRKIKVGSDDAVIAESEKRSIIAVQHGKSQFVLSWKALNATVETMDVETMPADRLVQLAAKAAAKIPTTPSLKRVVLPEECDSLDAEPIVGKILVAQGSASDDFLSCDYRGPDGILTVDATKVRFNQMLETTINVGRETRPEREVTPIIEPDTAIFDWGVGGDEGFNFQGTSMDCCEFELVLTPSTDDNDRSPDVDGEERKFLTDYVTAVREWGV